MMDAHYWLFPWLSLFASSVAACAGALLSGRPSEKTAPPGTVSSWLIAVWVVSIGAMIFGGLKLGDWSASDYIPARGILGGALGGILIAATLRRQWSSPGAQTALLFGLCTALICACRLWLTHGEVSGLMATAFSAGVTVLCFVIAPNIDGERQDCVGKGAVVLTYLVALVCSVLIGFTRAGTLGDIYWADIPLMIGAAICVGLIFAATLERRKSFVRSIAIIVTTLAVVVPLGITVAHSLPVIGLTVLGILAVGLPSFLVGRTQSKDLPVYLGFILLIAGITVSFSLMSGYGLVLFALGGLTVAATAAAIGVALPIPWLSFCVLLLVYRMEILQNGTSVDAVSPGDIWDLLAMGLGILLPRLVASWVYDYTPRTSWSTALQWLMAIAIPTLLLDYIWQPRSLTGLFLGLAIGQLVGNRADEVKQIRILAITAMLCALLLFLFLPGLDVLDYPTRTTRIVCVAALSTVTVIKIITHRHQVRLATQGV